MELSIIISIVALLLSAISALYGIYSHYEAKKANNINRLRILLELQKNYNDQWISLEPKLSQFKGTEAIKSLEEDIVKLDNKLRDVNKEISSYHLSVVNNAL